MFIVYIILAFLSIAVNIVFFHLHKNGAEIQKSKKKVKRFRDIISVFFYYSYVVILPVFFLLPLYVNNLLSYLHITTEIDNGTVFLIFGLLNAWTVIITAIIYNKTQS